MTNRILSTAHGVNREAFAPLDWGLFQGLPAIWGSSFLFMAVGLDAFHPGVVTLLRVGLGAATLALVPAAHRRIARADWPRLVVVAFLLGLPLTLSRSRSSGSTRPWRECCTG